MKTNPPPPLVLLSSGLFYCFHCGQYVCPSRTWDLQQAAIEKERLAITRRVSRRFRDALPAPKESPMTPVAQYNFKLPFLLVSVLLLLSLLSGCSCDSRLRESVFLLRTEFATYRAAVVPNPTYPDEQKARVDLLGSAIMTHCDEIVEASGE